MKRSLALARTVLPVVRCLLLLTGFLVVVGGLSPASVETRLRANVTSEVTPLREGNADFVTINVEVRNTSKFAVCIQNDIFPQGAAPWVWDVLEIKGPGGKLITYNPGNNLHPNYPDNRFFVIFPGETGRSSIYIASDYNLEKGMTYTVKYSHVALKCRRFDNGWPKTPDFQIDGVGEIVIKP